jgi:hypothetical protein
MRVEPTGIILVDTCNVQTEKCVAKRPAPITAVWTAPGRTQVNVCQPCLEEQIRSGQWEIQGARIRRRADVVVYSPDKRLQLVVEVKRKPRAAHNLRKWATNVRRNLLAHTGIPTAPYFLLAVLPNRFYLWRNNDPFHFDLPPDHEINAEKTLKPYFDQLAVSPDSATEYNLEAVVTSWLADLVKSRRSNDPTLEWLYNSGLFDAIKNGSVIMQAPVAA